MRAPCCAPFRRASARLPRLVLVLIVSLATAAGPLAAQDAPGEIHGTVVDAQRQAPVGTAEIAIPELDRRTVADGQGRFRFSGLPPGSYALHVRFLGYEAAVHDVEVPAGAARAVELRVAPGPVELEKLNVTVRSLTWLPGFRDRRENRTGHFFTRREIEEADPGHLTELLDDREGVRIGLNRNAHGPRMRYPQFHYRGPGEGLYCRPAVFVDGDMMGPGERWHHFNEIPPERVLGMEVYYRERDLPQTIDYDHRGQLSDEELGGLSEVTGVESRGASREGPGSRSRVRDVLAAAGMEGIFESPVPQRDDELALNRTTLAGLYEEEPRVEHCGAIFVWTRLYPLAED